MPSEASERGNSALAVRGGCALEGTVAVPGDKSLSHRALMCAAIADGDTRISGLSACADVGRTLAAMRALGVAIDGQPPDDVVVHGTGMRGLGGPPILIDCGDSGTTMRLLAGLLAGQDRGFTLDGSSALRLRPMNRVVEPLRALGAELSASEGGHPPLIGRPPGVDSSPLEKQSLRDSSMEEGSLGGRSSDAELGDNDRGRRLSASTFALQRASAQVGSAILFTALNAEGETVIRYPGPIRDHTERLLASMGAPIEQHGLVTRLTGPVERLMPPGDGRYAIAPDPSCAAFALAAAAIVPGSRVTALGLNVNPGRVGLFEILRLMGADISWRHGPDKHGEPTADVVVTAAELRGVEIGAELVPIAIDELPLFAVIATQASGRSVLRDAAELRVKECDRIAAIVEGLSRMGARITERPDGFEIEGPSQLRGATVDGHGDHRIVMALAVAGLMAEGETIVTDGERTADSYPGFVAAMKSLGAWIDRVEWRPEFDAQGRVGRAPRSNSEARPRTYALVGYPLGFSLSPAMHTAAFAAHGIRARYVLRPTPPGALGDVFDALRSGELDGVNVTVPHKVAAAQMVEDESGVVKRIGAVNTIVRDQAGFWRGENTDATGFVHVLRRMRLDDGRGRRGVVLGAGGAARAVVGVLLQAGFAVRVLNRSSARAAVLASHLNRHFPGALLSTGPFDVEVIKTAILGGDEWVPELLGDDGNPALIVGQRDPLASADADAGSRRPTLVVNTTSLGAGLGSVESPWPLDTKWPNEVALIDLVAWPPESALVLYARESGAIAEGGLEMLVAQAAASFRLWTGEAAPIRTMRKAALEAIETAGS